ncbi:hypothetical protein NN561_014187 [Cricetulus griseus]
MLGSWQLAGEAGRALGLRHGCSPDARIAAQWSQNPEQAGGRSAAALKAPQLRWPWTALKPRDPLSCPLQPLQPASNLPAPRTPTPLPTRVAEVCNLRPQPAREKRRELPDSPPGSTRRCRIPRGPGLRAVQTAVTNRSAGGPSGNRAAEQAGSRLSAQRSVAVPDSGRARCAPAAPTAAGCAADPPGSAELGSSTNPGAPTSSRPRAPERVGRRRAREQRGGGRQWGRSWEPAERRRGAGEKRRRGMERTCYC